MGTSGRAPCRVVPASRRLQRDSSVRNPLNALTTLETDRRYLAVVPAYNESSTIEHVIGSLYEHVPHYDVLVVDDGSTDDTGLRARALGAHIARLPFNLGIGGAMQT